MVASVNLSCIISFIRPRGPLTAGGVSFVDGNNVPRVRRNTRRARRFTKAPDKKILLNNDR